MATGAIETIAQPAAVRAIFDGIAPDYDCFNAWASFGQHQNWRRALVNRIPPDASVLDLATGTGDVALLARAAGHAVTGIDFSRQMLAKARAKDSLGAIQWVLGSADCLPFGNRTFGCVTSAFALRNFGPVLSRVFREGHRVLKTGGKTFHLEFGRPTSAWLRWGHRLHLRTGIPLIGQWFCGTHWPRQYLEKTIASFYEPAEVEQRLEAEGFSDVSHASLCFGAVILYQGTKTLSQ